MATNNSLIYWKIRCLNRQTKTYFDRMLILDWSKLTDEQATEVEALTKGTSSNPRILKYRSYFREVTNDEFLEVAKDVNSARGVCLSGLEYFEDENGEHIGIIEQIQTVTGEPDPIILGEPASIVRLGPSAIVRREIWATKTANNIAHLLQIAQQLAKSNWLRSPLSLSFVGETDGGQTVKRFVCPDDEATRSVLLLIRQLISSDEAFVSACKAYCCHVGDERKRWWMQERIDSFNGSRNSPPFLFPIGTRTTREIIELVMYGARLIHRTPNDGLAAELVKAIEQSGKQKVMMSFHACCRDLCHYPFSVYHVLRQELAHWVNNERCAPPDLIDTAELLAVMASGDAMSKELNANMCAYCGATDRPITRDHVVPKAIWKDRPLPPHVITVPACQPCQSEFDQDAAYFRNLIVVSSDPNDHPAIPDLAKGAIRRSIERSKRDRDDLTRNAMQGFHQFTAGSLYESSIRIDVDGRRLDRTPEKIIRGLFFYRNRYIVPTDYDVRIYPGNGFWTDPGFQNLLAGMEPWKTMGDDVFQMRASRDEQDHNFTVWLMAFYKSVAIFGYTCPKHYGRLPADSARIQSAP